LTDHIGKGIAGNRRDNDLAIGPKKVSCESTDYKKTIFQEGVK
jgi:hypothetical protein